MELTRLDELIEKYADGTATEEELEELLTWYRSADIEAVEWPAAHPDEREQLQQHMLNRLQGQIRDMPRRGTNPQTGVNARIRRLSLRNWRIAASLVLAVAASALAYHYIGRTPQPEYLTIQNPSGKVRALTLPDSSRVWLNAASSLRFPSTFTTHKGAAREVYLDGEGYFDVVTDPGHPFLVHAGGLTTKVLGTSFDIRSFVTDPQVAITVIRGKVQVGDSAKVLDVLTPARQLEVNTRTGEAHTSTIDTTQVLGWQQGRLQFPGQPMEEIAASLGRWYNVQFIFANPDTRRCRYYLNFESTISLPELLDLLEATTGLAGQIDENRHTVTLTGGTCQ